MTRKIKAFKRWMKSQGIDCSDALDLIHNKGGVCVKALCDLHEGDLVATIPKQSCLTIRTSGARDLIESAGLEGTLALSFAIMYERSLGAKSPWFDYLQLLPQSESIPLLWSLEKIDSLLSGTEIHKMVKEDKALIYEDWKACILPILDSDSDENLDPTFFGVDQYFAAKSLVASRSFEIDDYHESGMVPLADLFNHKTDAESVHFTAVTSPSESDIDPNDDDDTNNDDDDDDDDDDADAADDDDSNSTSSRDTTDNSSVREMIIVRDVKAGEEVYNTYGCTGNAGLLHRYGFTELDNPYDIINIDLELVLQWSSSHFSSRRSKKRLSLWRKLDYSGSVNESSDYYFEVSFKGEPELELLILLYLMLMPDQAYEELLKSKYKKRIVLSKKDNVVLEKGDKIMDKSLLLTKEVKSAILKLADIRESCYSESSIEEEIKALQKESECFERESYHSRVLRVSERRILEKLRIYAKSYGDNAAAVNENCRVKKKLKRR